MSINNEGLWSIVATGFSGADMLLKIGTSTVAELQAIVAKEVTKDNITGQFIISLIKNDVILKRDFVYNIEIIWYDEYGRTKTEDINNVRLTDKITSDSEMIHFVASNVT